MLPAWKGCIVSLKNGLGTSVCLRNDNSRARGSLSWPQLQPQTSVPATARAFACRTVQAHGTAVGLPTEGDMGNSEVGHNALGSGQVVSQGVPPAFLAVLLCNSVLRLRLLLLRLGGTYLCRCCVNPCWLLWLTDTIPCIHLQGI